MFVQLKDFPDYVVTDSGQVISLVYRNSSVRIPKWRPLKGRKNSQGYLVISLSSFNVPRTVKIHVLVAEIFIGPRPDRADINHIDGNKENNSLLNLEYCTRSENVKHAIRHGLYKPLKGSKHGSSKLTEMQRIELIKKKGTMLLREAAALYGISISQVSKIWAASINNAEENPPSDG